MAKEEVKALVKHLAALEDQAKVLLLPKDPLDDKNIMLEASFAPLLVEVLTEAHHSLIRYSFKRPCVLCKRFEFQHGFNSRHCFKSPHGSVPWVAEE